MKKLIIAFTMLISSNAYAWGNVGIPDPVTWLLHAAGGYAIAYIMDKHTNTSDNTGIIVATTVGLAKEVSDVNFSVPDFLSWSAGAWLYHRTKNMVRCPDTMQTDDWYIVRYEDKIEECLK